jgi:glycosyltransferase involved in cell wall biosynthesis
LEGFRNNVEVFSSTIIPTIGRSTLSRAVRSVLDQDFTEAGFEVIVVNDSGKPLPEAEWQSSDRVHTINTNRLERSTARNTGAAIAKGKYLHFLDDDDLLLPGALKAFWELDQVSESEWLYGSYQTVSNDGILIEEIKPEISGNIFSLLVAGESIPFQASLLRYEKFFSVGAFDPTLTSTEDRDLGRRIALSGNVANTTSVVAQIRIGEVGSTTNWAKLADNDRWGREKALNSPGAFARLWASSNSGYWHGRISRAYFASMVWNLKRINIFIAMSRGTALLSFAIIYVFSPGFWQGLTTKVK